MKKISEHVEHIKTKPHHIRKKVAFGTAGTFAGLIAFVWLAGSLSTNAFAIQGSSFAESTGQGAGVQIVNEDRNQGLAGAAAATKSDTSGPPRIEIVNVATSSPETNKREETTIPF